MCLKFILPLTVLLGCLHNGSVRATIAAFNIELKHLLRMQQGLGWPSSLQVVIGNDALMKLTKTVPDQKSCTVTTPAGDTFDISGPPNKRYESWGDCCGLRVHKVQLSDLGRWRLTSGKGNDTLTGWIEVYIEEDTPTYSAPPISLLDGETGTDIDLVSLDNSYCLVAQPFSQSSLVPGHCRVTLDKATRAVQGNWNVLVGLPGRVTELLVDRQVTVEAERLDVGFIHNENTQKIHMYCNILHTTKNITFCRFQKTTESVGYNVVDGLSDGVRSYYGNGFIAKECGMTIENAKTADFGTWRCYVGSQNWVNNKLVEQTPMQALINVTPRRRTRGSGDDLLDEDKVRTVFVQEGLSFTILCKSDVSLSYCWFMHPNGSQYSPVPHASDDQLFWYTGESLQFGDCGITFAHANASDAGDWACHMGAKAQRGVEEIQKVNVRVTGPLAATKPNLGVVIGQNATLFCHTANGNKPLDYCRFLSPAYIGISLDSSVTKENAILGRYYFTPERTLDYGDCSLTISSVEEQDLGQWTCAGVINTDTTESSDVINLFETSADVISGRSLTQAGILGMSAGIIVLVVVLVGVVWYKFGLPLPPKFWRKDQTTAPESTYDIMSMSTINRSSIATSGSSRSTETNYLDTNSVNGAMQTDRVAIY